MSVDLFSRSNALKLLHNKQIWFFGSSNTRCMYKDLVWLLENGNLVSDASLKMKNEMTHANDFKTSNYPLTGGRNYEETREYYKAGTAVSFTFLTKVFSETLTRALQNKSDVPYPVVVFNSCVWDLSRWGPNGVAEYKKNVVRLMEYFKKRLPSNCLVVFTTTPPLSSHCRGGFLRKEVEFLRHQLPWHVIEANNFLAETAKLYKYDVLDLHYYMRFLCGEWSPDGIHWSPLAYRLMTNLLLTHLALSFNVALPGIHSLDEKFIQKSQNSDDDITVKNYEEVIMIDSDSSEAHGLDENFIQDSQNSDDDINNKNCEEAEEVIAIDSDGSEVHGLDENFIQDSQNSDDDTNNNNGEEVIVIDSDSE